MSNRDALLLAAKKCLLEIGYNRTTARDVASAAGVSLAAIGYHFDSKDALLTEALMLAFQEWDEELRRTLATTVAFDMPEPERFQATWDRLISTFETHRSLWIANFEIFAQMVSQPTTRQVLAGNLPAARRGLAALFLGLEESTVSERTASTVGTFHHVLLSGLIIQWLIDPTSTLSGKELADAIRQTAQGLQADKKPSKRRRVSTKGLK